MFSNLLYAVGPAPGLGAFIVAVGEGQASVKGAADHVRVALSATVRKLPANLWKRLGLQKAAGVRYAKAGSYTAAGYASLFALCNRTLENWRSEIMLIGTMNHPGREVLSEIKWIAEMGFDFVDLTLEPPKRTSSINIEAVRAALQKTRLGGWAYGYYLPLCSPFESIRRAAVEELKLCLRAFAALGVSRMNLHPDRLAPFSDRHYVIERNVSNIRELMPLSRELGVGLMIENLPGRVQ